MLLTKIHGALEELRLGQWETFELGQGELFGEQLPAAVLREVAINSLLKIFK